MSAPSIRRSPISRRFARYKMQLAASEAVGRALRMPPASFSSAKQRRLKTLARRMSACAASTTIRLVTPSDGPTKIVYRNKRGCRIGLCSPCARQRARETVQRISTVLDGIIAGQPTSRFAFLTLTSRNMPIEQTTVMLTHHEAAMARFFRNARIAKAVQGHATGIEIAIRKQNDQWQAGVHSHSLLVLADGYFDKSRDLYLSQRTIVELWKKALRADYKPICHVKAIANTDAAQACLTECLKYAVAPHRLFEHADGRISVNAVVAAYLADALYKRRMCRTAGVFAKRRKAIKPLGDAQ